MGSLAGVFGDVSCTCHNLISIFNMTLLIMRFTCHVSYVQLTACII